MITGGTRLEEVRTIVRDVIEANLPSARVERVVVKPDEGWDGDPILYVTVVVNERRGVLEPAEMLGVLDHLRPRLEDVGCDDFPIIDYVSMKDAKTMNLDPR